jgi:uncharacterized protein
MKYHSEKMKNRLINSILFLFLLVFQVSAVAQSDIPDQPNPPRLYNNLSQEYSDFLNASETQQLEEHLENFARNTSNQIVVLVVDDLNGYEPWDYATRIGEKWQVGREKEDNGIIILIKPTGGKGQRKTFIATGRGLEGAIPDYTCAEIVNNEMIPEFKDGNFYQGIVNALSVLESLSKGEFNSDQYADKMAKKDKVKNIIVAFIIIAIIFFIVFKGRRGGGGGTTMGRGGRYYGGGFGGWGGGGSWGGGSSGGFGGFGGGSFGGGGAGGSW